MKSKSIKNNQYYILSKGYRLYNLPQQNSIEYSPKSEILKLKSQVSSKVENVKESNYLSNTGFCINFSNIISLNFNIGSINMPVSDLLGLSGFLKKPRDSDK